MLKDSVEGCRAEIDGPRGITLHSGAWGTKADPRGRSGTRRAELIMGLLQCQHRRDWVPAPNTRVPGKCLPGTIPGRFLQLMCGKSSFGSRSVLGGCCCLQPTWPRGLQPSGAAPFLPRLSVPNIALRHGIVKAAPRDGTAGAAGLCQLPRELRHLACGSGGAGSVPSPTLHAELVRTGTGVLNVLQICFTGKPRGSSPRAPWCVVGANGDEILGWRCKSGAVQEHLVPSHL